MKNTNITINFSFLIMIFTVLVRIFAIYLLAYQLMSSKAEDIAVKFLKDLSINPALYDSVKNNYFGSKMLSLFDLTSYIGKIGLFLTMISIFISLIITLYSYQNDEKISIAKKIIINLNNAAAYSAIFFYSTSSSKIINLKLFELFSPKAVDIAANKKKFVDVYIDKLNELIPTISKSLTHEELLEYSQIKQHYLYYKYLTDDYIASLSSQDLIYHAQLLSAKDIKDHISNILEIDTILKNKLVSSKVYTISDYIPTLDTSLKIVGFVVVCGVVFAIYDYFTGGKLITRLAETGKKVTEAQIEVVDATKVANNNIGLLAQTSINTDLKINAINTSLSTLSKETKDSVEALSSRSDGLRIDLERSQHAAQLASQRASCFNAAMDRKLLAIGEGQNQRIDAIFRISKEASEIAGKAIAENSTTLTIINAVSQKLEVVIGNTNIEFTRVKELLDHFTNRINSHETSIRVLEDKIKKLAKAFFDNNNK